VLESDGQRAVVRQLLVGRIGYPADDAAGEAHAPVHARVDLAIRRARRPLVIGPGRQGAALHPTHGHGGEQGQKAQRHAAEAGHLVAEPGGDGRVDDVAQRLLIQKISGGGDQVLAFPVRGAAGEPRPARAADADHLVGFLERRGDRFLARHDGHAGASAGLHDGGRQGHGQDDRDDVGHLIGQQRLDVVVDRLGAEVTGENLAAINGPIHEGDDPAVRQSGRSAYARM